MLPYETLVQSPVRKEGPIMSFLRKLFGRTEEPAAATPSSSECPHAQLAPRWDNVEDMGKADKVTGYVCEACKTLFSYDEGQQILYAHELRRYQEERGRSQR